MTAKITTPLRNVVKPEALEQLATRTRNHLERPIRHVRNRISGQLWERIAEQSANSYRVAAPEGDGGNGNSQD